MNRQKVFFTYILILMFSYAKGQDKIITAQNDTIFCTIISISLNNINYEQNIDNQTKVSNTILMKQVREYSFGFQSQESSTQQVQVTKPFSAKPFSTPSNRKQSQEPFPRWRLGVQGGGSYIINSLAPLRQAKKDAGVILPYQADNFYKKLREGISADANIHYLITRYLGIGVKYSIFTSSFQADYSVRNRDSEIPFYFSANEKESFLLNYVGPSILFQQWLGGKRKFRLNEELSVGYIFFRNEKQFDPYQYVFVNPNTNKKQYNVLNEGNTISGNFQLSLEYYPSPWLSIGMNGGIYPTIFRSLKTSDNNTSIERNFDKNDYLDLSRIDYSIGIRFHF